MTLTKAEYEKCKSDSVWAADIVLKTNYISDFKTYLLPKYRAIRNDLSLPESLSSSLSRLKSVYDSVLNLKSTFFLSTIDSNQNYIRPKAYISSLLSLEVFKFYPDVFAILLNDIHIKLRPITSLEDLSKFNKMVSDVLNSIPMDLYQKLESTTLSFERENQFLMTGRFSSMFQGGLSVDERRKCRLVNFLLWKN
nr:hypothetical protein [uncultured Flavobacterium sp.]